MVMETKNILENFKRYDKIIIVFIVSLLLFGSAAYYNTFFEEVMSVATYLTWHSLFEFASILAAFSIFLVTYHVYDESGSLRMILLGCTFLAMGCLDTFHTLSYKGMADFFISNDGANRATTFWIFSRLIGSIGFLEAVTIPLNVKCRYNKWIFVAPTIILVIVLLIIATYYPHVFPVMYVEGKGLTTAKIVTEYFIVFIMGITFLKNAADYKHEKSSQEYLFMISLLVSIFSEFAFISYGSVYDAFNYLGHIYKIVAYFILFKVIYAENVSIPYRELKKTKNELKRYSENLNYLVKQRTEKLEEINQTLMTDLEYAREMQRSMLPSQMPKDMKVSFQAEYLPAERLSGDFYNVIKLDENNIAVYIGDVSGHGVSAAMLTVFANQNIVYTNDETENLEIITPGFVLKKMYKSFNKTNFNTEAYLVMLYGVYNTSSGCFTYASGGLNEPPLVIKNNGEIIELNSSGFPICKLGEYFMPFFEDSTVNLEPGDKILFYTDGLVEAKNNDGEIYGQQNIKDFLKLNTALGAVDLKNIVKQNLFSHIGKENKLMDDATFLIMEVH
jgi:sigma-B regulation protein RsbU (phosphoserine phosphatase)